MSRWCVCEMSVCDRIWVCAIALEGQRERKINIISISAHVIVLVWVCMWCCVLVCACERVWVCVYVNLIIKSVCVWNNWPSSLKECPNVPLISSLPASQPFSVSCPEDDRAYVTQDKMASSTAHCCHMWCGFWLQLPQLSCPMESASLSHWSHLHVDPHKSIHFRKPRILPFEVSNPSFPPFNYVCPPLSIHGSFHQIVPDNLSSQAIWSNKSIDQGRAKSQDNPDKVSHNRTQITEQQCSESSDKKLFP